MLTGAELEAAEREALRFRVRAIAEKGNVTAPDLVATIEQSTQAVAATTETAPTIFARHDESGYSFVHRQPQTPEEIALAEEAIQGCPIEAIGNDGDAA